MIAVILILAFLVYLCFFFPLEAKQKKPENESLKYAAQMKKLWQVAQTSMKERKPFRAEKALLTILKFDEKNAAAYNRLGILYAKGQKYDEAVECFEIAQSLDNNPASIHNVGLIYLETGAYEKASMAFRQALALEGDVPARYIALAKAEEKMGNVKKAIEALESAYELDPKVATLRQILAIYEAAGDTKATTATTARIEEQIIKDNEAKKRKTRKVAGKQAVLRKGAATTSRAASKRRVITSLPQAKAATSSAKVAASGAKIATGSAKITAGGAKIASGSNKIVTSSNKITTSGAPALKTRAARVKAMSGSAARGVASKSSKSGIYSK